jgi:hypothetical protein
MRLFKQWQERKRQRRIRDIRVRLGRLNDAIQGTSEELWPEAIADYDAEKERLVAKLHALET